MIKFNYKFLIFPIILFINSCSSVSTINNTLSSIKDQVNTIVSNDNCKGSDCDFKGETNFEIKEEVLLYNEKYTKTSFLGYGWFDKGECKEGFDVKSTVEDYFVYLNQSQELVLQLGFKNKPIFIGNKVDLQVDNFKVLSNAIVEYRKFEEKDHFFATINITWFKNFLDQMKKGELLTIIYLDGNLTKKIEIGLSGVSESLSRLQYKKNNKKCLL